jgi:hypothetical protein
MSEMQRYDGWYNNLAHPAWGSIGELHLLSEKEEAQVFSKRFC